MRALAAFRYDMKFQFRHGFYTAYILVTLLYVGIILNVPDVIRPMLTLYLIFSDTAVLGFFFIGGIILLERRQRTIESLFVTPLRTSEYLWSKTVSLTILATIISHILLVTALGITDNLIWFSLGIILSAIFFILVGIAVAVRARTINGYFFRGVLYTIVFSVPVIQFIHLAESPIISLLPTWGLLVLLRAQVQPASLPKMLGAVALLIIWCGIAWWWADRWFQKYVILRFGEEL